MTDEAKPLVPEAERRDTINERPPEYVGLIRSTFGAMHHTNRHSPDL